MKQSKLSIVIIAMILIIPIIICPLMFINQSEIKILEKEIDEKDMVEISDSKTNIEIGDYVKYVPDTKNIYTLYENKTGYNLEDGTILKPENISWRVWNIEKDGTIVIVPIQPVNKFVLSGDIGFINSINVIEAVCDLYTNNSIGVTASDVRSMVVGDLEKVSTSLTTKRDKYFSESTYYPKYGETNVEQYGNSGYISGKFYTDEEGITILKTPRIGSDINPIVLKQTFYQAVPEWDNLNSSKFMSDTYGTLLGNDVGWLASPCVDLASSNAKFGVRAVQDSFIAADWLCDSSGSMGSGDFGIRPLVFLSSTLQVKGGNGETALTGWEF